MCKVINMMAFWVTLKQTTWIVLIYLKKKRKGNK